MSLPDKNELIAKIKRLEDLNREEKAELVGLLRQKRYGLVWEDKEEKVEEELKRSQPLLFEIKDRAVINGSSPDTPNHILIEGDNLYALTSLCFTHEGKIDVIYIDPPYNTGNKDFKYNDCFVDKEDGYRHSKWLSFMHKRLILAKALLKETGILFMSIDENEESQLKLLCDELFGETNFVSKLPTIMNLKGNQDEFGFAGTHEYTLVYCKNKMKAVFNQFEIDEEDTEWSLDEYGHFKKGANLKSTGVNAPREKRQNLFFPIFISRSDQSIYVTTDDRPKEKNDYQLLPITDSKEMSWRWSKKKIVNEPHNLILVGVNDEFSIYKKQRPSIGDLPSKKPKSLLYKPEYSSGNGTAQLKELLGIKTFNNPKPLDLIKDLLLLSTTPRATILDFFAGSGTTIHAVMSLNRDDGGSRQCIAVTNNENKIAEDICYERIHHAITGYPRRKGGIVEGLKDNNLRYYKTVLVSRETALKVKKQIIQLSTDLLSIKENCYTEVKGEKDIRLFREKHTALMIVQDDNAIPIAVKMIQQLPEGLPCKVYVFAEGQEPYKEDFYEVLNRVDLRALPEAIYNAYKNVLPKRRKNSGSAPEGLHTNLAEDPISYETKGTGVS